MNNANGESQNNNIKKGRQNEMTYFEHKKKMIR